jgi:hypothetical protein
MEILRMKYFRVGGLTGSGWQGMCAGLQLKRVESNTSVRLKRAQPDVKFAEWIRRCGEDDILLIGFDTPATSISAALNAGRDADQALTQWVEEAGAALAMVEANPHRVHLVSVSAAFLEPEELVGALALRTGLTFSTRKAPAPRAGHLLYWDFGERLTRGSAAALEHLENLRAGGLLSGSEGEPRSAAFKEAAAHHRLAQLARRATLDKLKRALAGVARSELGFATAARSLKGRAEGSDGELDALYDATTGLFECLEARSKVEQRAKAIVERDKASAQSALAAAEAEAASLERTCKDLNQNLAVTQETAAQRLAMLTEQQKLAAESALAQAAFDVAAMDVASAEADAEFFREAFELIVEDLASEVSIGPAAKRDWPTSSPVPQRQSALAQVPDSPSLSQKGILRWLTVVGDYWVVRRSPLFNRDWYRKRYPDLDGNRYLLLHYLLHGGAEGRSPSPFFCSQQYLDYYGDVRACQVNPLAHYLRIGRKEGRLAFPTAEVSRS